MLERFLRYVAIDTQSAVDSSTYPSTEKQLDLSRLLVDELRAIGLEDVELTEPGYVFATLPGHGARRADGRADRPRRHDPGHARHGRPADRPPRVGGRADPPSGRSVPGARPGGDARRSPSRLGHDLVTSDGTTLLGADDKAGVAAIMTAVAQLVRDDAPRATARIAFTVDEEVGKGTDHFDLDAFGADVAYTFDGSGLGEIEMESFSAYQLKLTIKGVGVHPGTAKGRLVNAVKLARGRRRGAAARRRSRRRRRRGARASSIRCASPAGRRRRRSGSSCATTTTTGSTSTSSVVRRLATRSSAREPRASFTLDVEEQYRNMRKVLDRHPEIVARRRGGDPARGRRAGAHHHPRRHRRRAADGEGAADAEPLHRRAALPLAARVGVAPGHGRGRGDVRRAREALGRAGRATG